MGESSCSATGAGSGRDYRPNKKGRQHSKSMKIKRSRKQLWKTSWMQARLAGVILGSDRFGSQIGGFGVIPQPAGWPTSVSYGAAGLGKPYSLQCLNRPTRCEAIEGVRTEVDPVRPDDSSSLRFHLDLFEEIEIR